jgi:MoxR-like ATPase
MNEHVAGGTGMDFVGQVKEEAQFIREVMHEVSKVVVGQEGMVEGVLLGMLAGGHVLLEGKPGLAKTLTVNTLAQTVSAQFQRIQFTPDLLPADLIGTLIYNPNTGEFTPKKGPLFANIVLADEINRAPAKVQSALLEAMQERQVTIGDTTYPLDAPFLVMATQNPIDQEGTYPLPEAQVDRFMMLIKVDYPTKEEERLIIDRQLQVSQPKVEVKITPERILKARRLISQLPFEDTAKDYIVNLVHATRSPADYGLGELSDYIQHGASPRASIWLAKAAQARAFMKGRPYVSNDDVKKVADDVLRHRIILSYQAEADGKEVDRDIIRPIKDQLDQSHVR